MSDGPFVHRHRVRYHELDPHDHVYNARYLEFVDVAMMEFIRELGWSFAEALEIGFDPLLAHLEIDFRCPALHDAELEIAVLVRRIGSASFDLEFPIHTAAGHAIAEITVAYVNVDPDTKRAAPLPPIVRERLERHLRVVV